MPVRSLQLDSWFYPHEHTREVSPAGAGIVPPSGMLRWEPREDLFPGGFAPLRAAAAGLPLTLHSRHFAAASPYFARHAAWRDGSLAHPRGPDLLEQLLGQAATWGAITYEQDWMVETFLGVRALRAAPGRARAWLRTLDRAAGEHGLNLQWCMATPADFMEAATLPRVASIRTSGDYRYLFDNGLNWVWFLQVNALARALGLLPFKDVFISHGPTPDHPGEPYAEVEALLAALSAGPVGIGDQIGQCDAAVVMRTCREDGVLVKPDVPVAALDRCFRYNAFFNPVVLAGDAWSAHPAGPWRYVVALNAHLGRQRLATAVHLDELGPAPPAGPVVAYDWRRRTWSRLAGDGGWDVALDFQDWDYRVVCPWLDGIAVIGDVAKYACAGDRRLSGIARDADGLRFDVLGAPGATVTVTGCAEDAPRRVHAWTPAGTAVVPRDADPGAAGWAWDAASGFWTVHAVLPVAGRIHVVVRPG